MIKPIRTWANRVRRLQKTLVHRCLRVDPDQMDVLVGSVEGAPRDSSSVDDVVYGR